MRVCACGEHDVRAVRSLLEGAPALETLDFGGNWLGVDFCSALAAVLPTSCPPALRSLSLAGTHAFSVAP